MRLQPRPRFHARLRLPGDKAVCHRLAILGAMASGTTRIRRFSSAADCASTLSCLRALGVDVSHAGDDVRIEGRGIDALRPAAGPLDAGNSGSTLRMLAGVLAGRPFRSVLTGDASLQRRPMERIAAPLRALGARVGTLEGRPPVTVDGGALSGITWTLPVPSAQVKTAVLLAGLQASGRTTVVEPTPSRDHTERWLGAFGVTVERTAGAVSVVRAPLVGQDVESPGDVSSAAFLVVAALIVPDGHVRLERVLLNPGRIAFLDVLRAMGADVRHAVEDEDPEPVGWIEARSSALRGTDVAPAQVPALIDEVPALAVAACHATGTFRVTGASELRVKESDRIAALAEGLGRMGARVMERPDGLEIEGGVPLHGAAVRAHDDHRIAMALAVAALAAEGETDLEGADAASVSFPEFYSVLDAASRG